MTFSKAAARNRLAIAALACAMVAGSRRAEAEAGAKAENNGRRSWNVVFILADDLGWRDTSLYGSTFYETPNLERLARRGMRFMNAYAANPLCSPTRASILTGLYPARIGITAPVCHQPTERLEAALVAVGRRDRKALEVASATRLSTNYFTLTEALKQAGYVTGHFGKWHLGPEPYSPLQQGFDVDIPHHSGPGPAGSYMGPWKFPPALKFTGEPGEHIEDRMAKEAIRFIKTNKDRPFYLNYWAFSVHGPWDAKPELIEKYREKAEAAGTNSPQRNPVYGAMVQSLDENIGKLMNTLDDLKLSDQTIIIFFSDNGGVHWPAMQRQAATSHTKYKDIPITSNAPLRAGKASLYEGGVREPCVVVWPGNVKLGSKSDAFLSSVDFYPTVLDMLGLKPRPGQTFDGVSQIPTLLGKGEARDTVFCYFPHYTRDKQSPGASVRRGDWKLLRLFCDSDDQSDRFELYNLKKDVGETRNLAVTMPDKVKGLNSLLDGFLAETKALIPKPNPGYDATSSSSNGPPALKPAPRRRAKSARRAVGRENIGGGAFTNRQTELAKATAGALPGLTVENGVLLRRGKPYRGIGVNFFNAFLRTLSDPLKTNFDSGFRALAELTIPFARICGGAFWPAEMELYVTNRAEYFRRFDEVVHSAEKHGVGLIPSLFWFYAGVPDLVGEPCDQWGNSKSRTRAFMREYVRDLVTRYKDSPAIWGWEFGNEFNLHANLPNAGEHRPFIVPHLGTPTHRGARDDLTYEIIRDAFAEFAREVRRCDPYRVILTGDSILRSAAWHNWKENNWKRDSVEQFLEMLRADNPDPIDLISVHLYGEDTARLTNVLAAARQLHKPVFAGEFGVQGPRAKSEPAFRELLAAIETNGVPLAAVWVFDFKSQDTNWNITTSNDRAYQLRAVAEANRRIQEPRISTSEP